MKDTIKNNLKKSSSWMRVFFMLLFAVFYSIAIGVMHIIVIFQMLATLFTGSPNQRVIPFSASLAKYIYNILRYLTFNTDEKPFPFSDWKQGDPSDIAYPEITDSDSE